jgi:hypothetical protein
MKYRTTDMGLALLQGDKWKLVLFWTFYSVLTSNTRVKTFYSELQIWASVNSRSEWNRGHCGKCCGSMQFYHWKYGTVDVQLDSYQFNLDRRSCILTGSSWFLLSGSEPSVILKISKPLKESGLLATASSHLRHWRYPMCLSQGLIQVVFRWCKSWCKVHVALFVVIW